MHWRFLILALLLGCSRPVPEPESDASIDAGNVYGVEVGGEAHSQAANEVERLGVLRGPGRYHAMGVRKPHPPDPSVVECQERFGGTNWKTFKACLDAIPAGTP